MHENFDIIRVRSSEDELDTRAASPCGWASCPVNASRNDRHRHQLLRWRHPAVMTLHRERGRLFAKVDSISTPVRLDLNEHRACARSCNHYCMMRIRKPQASGGIYSTSLIYSKDTRRPLRLISSCLTLHTTRHNLPTHLALPVRTL